MPISAWGATYYVAKIGSDAHSCTQARSSLMAKGTIAGGLRCLSGGDTLIIKGGTYTEGITVGQIPSGKSRFYRTTIKAAANDVVIINGVNALGDALSIYDRSYILIDGLRFNGHRIRVGGNGPRYSHYITIQNSIIANTVVANYPERSQSCVTQQGPGGANSHINFINNEVYNCGPETGHGIYLSTRDSIIEGNRVHNNAKFGIHLYSTRGSVNNNVIRYNRVYNNGAFGILVGSGAHNKVYGNIVRNNAVGGIEIGFGSADGNEVYDNEIYQNGGDCIGIKSKVYNSKVKGNACRGNGNDRVSDKGVNTTLFEPQ